MKQLKKGEIARIQRQLAKQQDSKMKLMKNLHSTYCCFGRSELDGIGVIAIRDIPKGINPFPTPKESSVSITDDDLSLLPKVVASKIKDTFVSVGGVYQVYELGLNSMGLKFHINHSNKPNVAVNSEAFDIDVSPYNPFITLREIKKGEELCWNYEVSNGDDIPSQFDFIKKLNR